MKAIIPNNHEIALNKRSSLTSRNLFEELRPAMATITARNATLRTNHGNQKH